MAEIAFVNDIRGVCNSRDTRVTTPRPMNVDSMNTKSASGKLLPDSAVASEAWAKATVDATAIKVARHTVRMNSRILPSFPRFSLGLPVTVRHLHWLTA